MQFVGARRVASAAVHAGLVAACAAGVVPIPAGGALELDPLEPASSSTIRWSRASGASGVRNGGSASILNVPVTIGLRPCSSATPKAEATDREIDRLVYELYRLTAEEIAVVEG